MQKFDKSTGLLTVDRYLPHNFLAEKIILSSLLINIEVIELVLRTVKIETFYFKNHQQLYKVIMEMYRKKLSIDIITLYSFLRDNGLLNTVGGTKILIELVNYVPNILYLEEYVSLINDKYLRRCLIKLGYKTITSAYITNLPLELILNSLELEVFNLTNEIKTQKIYTNAELLSNIFLDLKHRSLNPSLSGLASGFYELDLFTQGFQKSDLIIIAGRPSMGKTALALNIGLNIIKTLTLPVLFFTLEMSKEQLMYRIINFETDISSTRLKTGNLYKEDWIKLNTAIQNLSSLPLFLDDTASLTIHGIKMKIKKILFEQNKIGLIIIDYLQLMQNLKFKTETRSQELSQITRSLKNIAREFQVPIIALSQLSRSVENRVNKRPILSDLRESGSIEQDADVVLMLYRNSYYSSHIINTDSTAQLIIAKQRNGPTGTVNLQFNPKLMKFSE